MSDAAGHRRDELGTETRSEVFGNLHAQAMQIAPNIQGDQIIAAGHFVHRDAPKEFVIHQAVYREYGYELVDVPPATVAQRAALVEQLITSTAR